MQIAADDFTKATAGGNEPMHTEQERIKRDVVEQLYWDQRVDSSEITVETSATHVRLTGTVPSYHARMAAEYDAWQVAGVSRVTNELTVAFSNPASMPSDESVQAH